MKRTTILFVLTIIMSSCMIIGINTKRKAPKKAGEYPVFTEKDSLRGYLSPERACFDVNYYVLDIVFDLPNKSLSGRVDIHFQAVNEFNRFQLDLYENMTIDKIVYEGQTLAYTRKFDACFVTFNRAFKPAEHGMVSVYYHGQPQKAKKAPWDGGTVWKKDKAKKPWCGVACELDGASLWWPLKDHLSDEPDSAQMRFTVPKGLFCVSNGKLIERRAVETDMEQFVWQVNSPINHYNISYYIGDYQQFTIPYQKDTLTYDLNYYVLPQHLEVAKSHFKQTNDILRFYEKIFGDYQWFEDGYKLVESPYAGMEHQSAIAYGDAYKNNSNGVDYIILHETAHEWWGNSVSVGDFADIWLHEGFATYSEALYIEEKQGYRAYLSYLYWYSLMIKNKKPMVGPRDVKYWTYKDSDPYMKGALTLHSLRSTMDNDSLFFDILKTFHVSNQRKIVTSDDFIQLVNEKTNANYDWFFKQFLYNRKPPKFTYALEFKPHKNRTILRYKWSDVDTDFIMPIEIYKNGKQTRIFPTVKSQKLELFGHVEQLRVDPLSFYTTVLELKVDEFKYDN